MIIPLSGEKTSADSDGDSTDPLGVARIERFISNDSQSGGQLLQVTSGNTCGTTAAEVQYFVFRANRDAGTYTQERVAFPSTIGLWQESNSLRLCHRHF